MKKSGLLWGYALSPLGFSDRSWQGAKATDLSFDALLRQVEQAGQAGFDFVTLFDGFGQRPTETIRSGNTNFEPTTLVSALSSRAGNIGFLAAASTVQHEAYNLARRFASLDTINGGRTGWIVLDDSTEAGRDLEYIDVVRGLWDSWDADAFIYDKQAGRFFDPSKMHVLQHKGPHLSVRGPLNVNRSPQDIPIIASVHGRGNPQLAARHADLVILQSTSVAATVVDSRLIREQVGDAGRDPSDIRVVACIAPADDGNDRIGKGTSAGVTGIPLVVEDDVTATLTGIASDADIDGFIVVPPSLSAAQRFIAAIGPTLISLGLDDASKRMETLRSTLGLNSPRHQGMGRGA